MSKKDEAKVEDDGIVVKDPVNLRQEVPLVVTLPEGASQAQVEFAKILNGFAVSQPEKWLIEKNDRDHVDEFGNKTVIKGLLTKLRELKNAPDPVVNPQEVKIKNTLVEN